MSDIAFIAIGRNEGERLKHCLQSLRSVSDLVIYVDSGSTDGSTEFARSLGVEVVDLDTSRGFTMARGRNAGLKRLLEMAPGAELVHFIDGDCELVEGWLPKAVAFIGSHPRVAAVCGRRRERFPEASPYNLLCEMEWNTPVGEALASGGDVLMRLPALVSVGAFNESLIAYEEPDLCRRLRNNGWKIWRLEGDMTRHDANILRLGQWWKRHERAGYGAMVITDLCRREADTAAAEHFGGQVKSPRGWVIATMLLLMGGIPLAAFLMGGWGVLLLLLFMAVLLCAQAVRIACGMRRRAPDFRAALLYGVFTMMAKFPQVLGQIRYAQDRSKGRKAKIIEYK
jgi:GT2 family glycosyltransferase